ncbi:MAG: chemoreceptor glutamine deamidase CheD [Burkholderiales bacterium]|jgi:chemotaxis protein CheD
MTTSTVHKVTHNINGFGTATHVFFDRHFHLPSMKILPGEYYGSGEDIIVNTVLGSCVSACIWDKKTGMGGMNHFMLPDTDEKDFAGAAGRFGTYAMELLINDLMKHGAHRDSLECKLFGGGNVMKGFTTMNVGERNAQFALDFLKTEKIRITAQDLLDVFPRKVIFFTKTGRALVKKLREDTAVSVVTIETKYRSTLQTEKVAKTGGDIELF